jgi:hypothetical protein
MKAERAKMSLVLVLDDDDDDYSTRSWLYTSPTGNEEVKALDQMGLSIHTISAQ